MGEIMDKQKSLLDLMEYHARLTLLRDSIRFRYAGVNICHEISDGYKLPKKTPKALIKDAKILLHKIAVTIEAIERLSRDIAPTYPLFECKKRTEFKYLINAEIRR